MKISSLGYLMSLVVIFTVYCSLLLCSYMDFKRDKYLLLIACIFSACTLSPNSEVERDVNMEKDSLSNSISSDGGDTSTSYFTSVSIDSNGVLRWSVGEPHRHH